MQIISPLARYRKRYHLTARKLYYCVLLAYVSLLEEAEHGA